MTRSDNAKGFTLVEILVSIAILGIVAIFLLPMFTSGFSSLMSMGRKTNALAQAQAVIDKVYEEGTPTTTYLDSLGENVPFADAFVDGDLVRYQLNTKTVDGKSFTQLAVLVFYQNGQRNVTLSALIP
jgi:prepilin-type N-terminal cleavage/methylation domain-containing protein